MTTFATEWEKQLEPIPRRVPKSIPPSEKGE